MNRTPAILLNDRPGCVDGFSRSIIYFRINDNNQAVTVLNYFKGATRMWGHPSRVRTDDGEENIAVGEYMEWYRGVNMELFDRAKC